MNSQIARLAASPADLAEARAHLKWAGVGRTLPGVRISAAIVAAADAARKAEGERWLATAKAMVASTRPTTARGERRAAKKAARKAGQVQVAA